jgi:hypothetical protein
MEPQVLLAMGDAYYGDKNQILLFITVHLKQMRL